VSDPEKRLEDPGLTTQIGNVRDVSGGFPANSAAFGMASHLKPAPHMRQTSIRLALVPVVAAFATASAHAQLEPTLRDLVRDHGDVEQLIQGCGPTPSFADVVNPSDLIVRGIVSRRTSYLTRDERDIYTDYELTILQVLFQREVIATSRPGVAVPIVFKSQGGHLVIDGHQVIVEAKTNNATVSLNVGEDVYLFARRDATDGKWVVTPYDVFTTNGAEVSSPVVFADLPKSVPQQIFLQRAHELQPAAVLPF
jgi:hypothetical protein